MNFRLLFFLLALWSFALSAQEASDQPTSVTIHIVQRGESLWRIARNYGMTVDELARLNGLPSTSGIFAGQRLLVPDRSSPQPALTVPPQAAESFHVVTRGETLFRIAQAYGLTVGELASANNIRDPSLIYAGQRLLIPVRADNAPTAIMSTFPPPISDIRLRATTFVEGQAASAVITTTEPASVSVLFLDETVTAIPDDTRTTHTLLRGVPMFVNPGQRSLRVTATSANASAAVELPITIVSGRYVTTNIALSPSQQALLAPGVEEFELGTLRTLTTQISTPRAFTGLMSLPAAAPMNAPFGTRRSYNGGAVDRYHNGADFATPPGSPVFAAAPGRIVLADLLNIRGNSVLIDHGWGIFTLYAHLNTINVRLGETVAVGQVIGTSGSTGRVTGPHLHWEVWVAGVAVDPMLWTQQVYP
ncbi:LysM peptidoglycan-binding domain-containing protein [Aggregatilineales bacterium SYSU G02658]